MIRRSGTISAISPRTARRSITPRTNATLSFSTSIRWTSRAGKEELIYQQDGNNNFAAANDSGSKFIVSRDGIELSLDNNLYLVDAANKTGNSAHAAHRSLAIRRREFSRRRHRFAHRTTNANSHGLAQMRKKNAAGDDWSDANREARIIDDRHGTSAASRCDRTEA